MTIIDLKTAVTYPHEFVQITRNGLEPIFRDSIPGRERENPRGLPPETEQVALCLEWLDRFASQRPAINLAAGSYTLKHMVERWAGTYVSNGAFIYAAWIKGYPFQRGEAGLGGSDINCCFAMNFRDSDLLERRERNREPAPNFSDIPEDDLA